MTVATIIPGPTFDNGAGATCEYRIVRDGDRWIVEEQWHPSCAPSTDWQVTDPDAFGFMSVPRAAQAIFARWDACDVDGFPGFDADRWPEIAMDDEAYRTRLQEAAEDAREVEA